MSLIENYLPQALAELDAEPESRLAVSLHNLYRADDLDLIGFDLFKAYLRRTDPATFEPELAADLARYRRALDILRGNVLLRGGTSYVNVKTNLADVGGLRLLADETEARDLVGRVIALEPVLTLLVEDRRERHLLALEPGYRGGPDLADHVDDVKATLASDPDGFLAVSLNGLLGAKAFHWAGVLDVVEVIRDADPEDLAGPAAEALVRLRRAADILSDRISLDGMTYSNLEANVHGIMGDLGNFAPGTEARILLHRVLAASPRNRLAPAPEPAF